MTFSEFLHAFTTETENDGCKSIHRGLTELYASDVDTHLPRSFHFQEGWEDAHFRWVWASDKEYSIITYCEGDIIVEVWGSRKGFTEGLQNAAEFYAKN